LAMSQSPSRGRPSLPNSLALKLARFLPPSRALVLSDVLPAFRFLYTNDGDLKLAATLELGFDEKEVAYLLDEKEDSHPVRHLMERVAKVRGKEAVPAGGLLEGTEQEGGEMDE